MKRLILMRHGKASTIADHDFIRALSREGEEEVVKVGHKIVKENIKIDEIVCSTAVRAKQTMDIFCRESQLVIKTKRMNDLIYGATAAELFKVINEFGLVDVVMIVGHNPGLGDVASRLLATHQLFSTATLAILDFDTNDWQNVRDTKGELKLLLTP